MCDNARMASFWSNRNLGGTRDAVLVNGLGTLAGCASIMLAIILQPEDEAFGPGLGVAFSATGVLLTWSLTLAIRAWRRGERNGWCRAVMVLDGLETVFLGAIAYFVRFVLPMFPFSGRYQYAWQWELEWALETGVIVFLSVGVIACLGAAPVAWWRVRRAAKRDAKEGIQGRSHWKRGLIWFCAVAALLVALLLPSPLFLYCAVWDSQHAEHTTWRNWVLDNTPVFVADTAAGALTLSSHAIANRSYHCALQSGRVSKNRLLAEVYSSDPLTRSGAFEGLEHSDPQAALPLAEQIGQGRTFGTSQDLRGWAGWMMSKYGTAERIRHFLDQAATRLPPPFDFMRGLLWGLRDRPEFLPELAGFCRKDSANRGVALCVLAWILPPKDVPGVWAEFLADSDPLRRQQAIGTVANIRDLNVRLAIFAACLESPDPSVRQEMHKHLGSSSLAFHDCESRDSALAKRLAQSLLPILDDADRNCCCAAAWNLSVLIGDHGTFDGRGTFDDHGTLQKEMDFFRILSVSLARGMPVQATPQEQELLDSIRAAARKWLDERK
ncbi:MAG: hypothetical protein ABSE73_00205 [Planctomycetota bacterium]